MFEDVRWTFEPFRSSHRDSLRAAFHRQYPTEGVKWFSEYKPIGFLTETINRINTRATGTLTVSLVPFTVSAYLFSERDAEPVISGLVFVFITISVVSLFRCVSMSWITTEMAENPRMALDYYLSVLFIRIQSLYVGTFCVFLVVLIMLSQFILGRF